LILFWLSAVIISLWVGLVVSKARVSLLVSIVTTEPVSDNTSLSFSSKEAEIK